MCTYVCVRKDDDIYPKLHRNFPIDFITVYFVNLTYSFVTRKDTSQVLPTEGGVWVHRT